MKSLETDCKICGAQFSSLGGLHGHLSKTERIAKEDYYSIFFPRFDIQTGRQIVFKSHEDYFKRRFADKKNEFNYIKKNKDCPVVREIISEQLDLFVGKSKRLPTYIEWRSSKNFRYDYLEECSLLNVFFNIAREKKFLNTFSYEKPKNIKENSLGKILIDTREQKPLFSGSEVSSINVGDYTFDSENYTGVHIDRKSKEDFISTFTSGLDRFKREAEKAKNLGVVLVVLVEASYSDCFGFRPLKFSKQRVTGENAFHGLRQISREYDIQFLFVSNREEAAEYVRKILSNKKVVTDYDLQYLYEKGWF